MYRQISSFVKYTSVPIYYKSAQKYCFRAKYTNEHPHGLQDHDQKETSFTE